MQVCSFFSLFSLGHVDITLLVPTECPSALNIDIVCVVRVAASSLVVAVHKLLLFVLQGCDHLWGHCVCVCVSVCACACVCVSVCVCACERLGQ